MRRTREPHFSSRKRRRRRRLWRRRRRKKNYDFRAENYTTDERARVFFFFFFVGSPTKNKKKMIKKKQKQKWRPLDILCSVQVYAPDDDDDAQVRYNYYYYNDSGVCIYARRRVDRRTPRVRLRVFASISLGPPLRRTPCATIMTMLSFRILCIGYTARNVMIFFCGRNFVVIIFCHRILLRR